MLPNVNVIHRKRVPNVADLHRRRGVALAGGLDAGLEGNSERNPNMADITSSLVHEEGLQSKA